MSLWHVVFAVTLIVPQPEQPQQIRRHNPAALPSRSTLTGYAPASPQPANSAWLPYAVHHAATHPNWHAQAQHRVDCLRGRAGERRWKWTGIL